MLNFAARRALSYQLPECTGLFLPSGLAQLNTSSALTGRLKSSIPPKSPGTNNDLKNKATDQ